MEITRAVRRLVLVHRVLGVSACGRLPARPEPPFMLLAARYGRWSFFEYNAPSNIIQMDELRGTKRIPGAPSAK